MFTRWLVVDSHKKLSIKAYSHGVIAPTISLLQLMGCTEFNGSVQMVRLRQRH